METARRLDQTDVAGVNEIDDRQTAVLKAVRELHDQTQVRLDELRNSLCGWC